MIFSDSTSNFTKVIHFLDGRVRFGSEILGSRSNFWVSRPRVRLGEKITSFLRPVIIDFSATKRVVNIFFD